MNILITGATGFLGSALARCWVRDGHKVTALSRPASSLVRLTGVVQSLKLVTCVVDDELIELVQEVKPDVVVHTACAYGRGGESALQIFDTNVRLGLLLIDGILASNHGCVRFINTGTVLDPRVGTYAMSKQQFSELGDLLARNNSSQLQFVNVRLQHMYGPGDDQGKFSSQVLLACQSNHKTLALTEGMQRRDFIYVDDVVSAYDTILRNLDKFSFTDQVDVGSGDAPTIRHFVETVHSVTNSQTLLQFGALPYREHEAMLCQADLRRMKELGWYPAHDLEKGIRKTIELGKLR